MNFFIDFLLITLMMKNIKFVYNMVKIEELPLKFSETKKDSDQKSHFSLKIQNVLCTLNLY